MGQKIGITIIKYFALKNNMAYKTGDAAEAKLYRETFTALNAYAGQKRMKHFKELQVE